MEGSRAKTEMNCDICGQESWTLFKVRHRGRGEVKICEGCLIDEKKMLLPSKRCSCC